MTAKKITFKISRFKKGDIDPARFFTYVLAVDETMTALDAVEKIRITQEPSLMYRHSCHHSSCGTCACLINDAERLLCTTNVWALEAKTITMAPLNGFPRIGDLVVNMNPFFRDIGEEWTYLQPSLKKNPGPKIETEAHNFTQFENCIECGSCISTCPVSRSNPYFMGPAALTAMHREFKKDPVKKSKLLSEAANDRGIDLCDRALNCSRVCPTAVYPARHIIDLKKE